MSNYTTYSFNDINAIISPPGFGSASTIGNGIGDINISFSRDNTQHDPSADGSVMVSKIVANEGSISISCQQTSQLHQYLKSLFNHMMAASTSIWAAITITISSPNGLQDYVVANGVSFQKRSDQPYQVQGQTVTWTFMATNIQYPAGGNVFQLVQ